MARPIAVVPTIAPGAVVETTRLFVRALEVMAPIGVYPQERLSPQRLVIDVEMEIAPVSTDRLEATFDYGRVGEVVASVIAEGHSDLIESFARRVGERLLASGPLRHLVIRVEKPGALAPAALAASVELRMRPA